MIVSARHKELNPQHWKVIVLSYCLTLQILNESVAVPGASLRRQCERSNGTCLTEDSDLASTHFTSRTKPRIAVHMVLIIQPTHSAHHQEAAAKTPILHTRRFRWKSTILTVNGVALGQFYTYAGDSTYVIVDFYYQIWFLDGHMHLR